MNESVILQNLNLFIWAKDKSFRYIYCNENYAKAAGLDSPEEIIGKSDDQMPWREQADFFRIGDQTVFDGKTRINVPEVEVRPDRIVDILVTENKLLDKNEKCLGLIGSYIDITGKRLETKTGHFDRDTSRYYLGEVFGNDYLTWREIEILKKLLLGYTAKQSAEVLKISPKTVESHIDKLRMKLQATTKGDIIATAIKFGLTQVIYLQCL